eukprot:g15873.t1
MNNKIPDHLATHQVGCGGFVLNAQRELLVVKEKASTLRPTNPPWKLPGGMLHHGETFGEAVTREVMEETGVRARFESLLCFWHRHDLKPWGQSDMYVVCLLATEEREGRPEFTLCQEEIDAAKWIGLDDYAAAGGDHDHPLILTILHTLFNIHAANPTLRAKIVQNSAAAAATRGRNSDFAFLRPPGRPGPSLSGPAAEMVEVAVQWPNRPVYPTYFPRTCGGPAGAPST